MTGAETLLVRRIEQVDAHTLGIEWNDGHKGRWSLAHLRRNCPCALCRDEDTGRRLLDPGTVPENLSARVVESVGRYALRIEFSDGHDTGIYTFAHLREICQCDLCRSRDKEDPSLRSG